MAARSYPLRDYKVVHQVSVMGDGELTDRALAASALGP